jgi:hypothetical protein
MILPCLLALPRKSAEIGKADMRSLQAVDPGPSPELGKADTRPGEGPGSDAGYQAAQPLAAIDVVSSVADSTLRIRCVSSSSGYRAPLR